jgi:hypothetical protein
MTTPAEKYRLKALACEKLGREATDHETRIAWVEIAIEWHALASRMALEFGGAGLRNQTRAATESA